MSSLSCGEMLKAFVIELSSINSENFSSILFPLNSKAPDAGKLEISSGAVLSSGPPLGGEIAAHEKKIIENSMFKSFLCKCKNKFHFLKRKYDSNLVFI
tara:strand:- start:148 stop:444 length:297 start_codon:yes stop_codon:yes gene_type:complete